MQRLVYLTYLLMVSSAGVTFIFLEEYETDFGIPTWGIGLISSLSFATTVVAALAIAPFGDRGHIKALSIFALVTAIIGNLWIGFATELWSIAISRGLTGISAGLFSVVGRKALIGDSTEDSGEKIGGFISAAVAGFILGPAVGAQLSEWGGIETPYLVIAALLALIAIPTVRWLTSAPIATSSDATLSAMWPLLRSPGARAAVAAQMAMFFNLGVFDSTVDEYLTSLGVSNSGVGLLLLVVASPLLIMPRLTGRYVDSHHRPASVLLVAFALFVPIILALGLFAGVLAFTLLAFAQTVMESTVFPSATRVVVDETGAEHSAIGTSLLEAAGSSAGAISAFIAPLAFDAAGGPIGSFGMSSLVAAALLVYAWWNVRQRDLTHKVGSAT